MLNVEPDSSPKALSVRHALLRHWLPGAIAGASGYSALGLLVAGSAQRAALGIVGALLGGMGSLIWFDHRRSRTLRPKGDSK